MKQASSDYPVVGATDGSAIASVVILLLFWLVDFIAQMIMWARGTVPDEVVSNQRTIMSMMHSGRNLETSKEDAEDIAEI